MTQRVDILMCTFRRPQVGQAIAAIGRLRLPEDAEIRLVIADNDDTDSAREIVESAASDLPFECVYMHVPARNISLARNACLDAASRHGADWIASLDDDETVDPDWLVNLLAAPVRAKMDGALGKVIALYPDDAPEWLGELDLHSFHPGRHAEPTRFANSGNFALRWHGTAWEDQRYELARGTTGGEDTEFFQRLWRMGVRMIAAADAVVTEPVPPKRQTLEWLSVRRYRMGQTHTIIAEGGAARLRLFVMAAAKAGWCRLMQAVCSDNETRRNFWFLRGQLHRGVCAGLLNRPQPELYGRDPV